MSTWQSRAVRRWQRAGGLIPGPPRGRRRGIVGDLPARVRAMQEAEAGGGGSLLRLTGEVILLLKDLAADPRVPRGAKIIAASAAAYLVLPVDVVPDWVPVLGQVDDLVIVGYALRRLLTAAGYEVVYDLWRGSNEGLVLVLNLAGIED